MNPSAATHPVTEALNRLNQLYAARDSLAKLDVDNKERRVALEISVDLSDPNGLAEVGRLQAIDALLPRRAAHVDEQTTSVEQSSLKIGHNFISAELSPRISALSAQARKQARATLEKHIFNREVLNAAVEKSELVEIADSISFKTTITNTPTNGVVAYLESLLNAWAECDTLEARLSA